MRRLAPRGADWALLQLTGRFVTDSSLASRTNLLHLDELEWDAEVLALFELPRSMLCDAVPPGSIIGGLVPGVARATGLVCGLPVVSAGGDQRCAALGLGLLSHSHAVANAGTGGFVIGHADHPLHDPVMRISCNVSAVPGAWIVEAATLIAGSVHEWFRGIAGDVDPAALEAEAAQETRGCHGMVMLPHFEGSGSPHWDPQARGAFVQLGLHTTRGTLSLYPAPHSTACIASRRASFTDASAANTSFKWGGRLSETVACHPKWWYKHVAFRNTCIRGHAR